jgi:hypothetical protein
MDLTTVERVKRRLGIESDDQDDVIGRLISSISRQFEIVADRYALIDDRTVIHDVEHAGQRRFYLRGYPVVEITSVHYSPVRTFDPTTLLASTYYAVRGPWLTILDTDMEESIQSLQVVYNGGMAEDTDAFWAAFPDVADAVDVQAAFLRKRDANLGVASVSDPSGSANFQQTIELLPYVRQTFESYRYDTA